MCGYSRMIRRMDGSPPLYCAEVAVKPGSSMKTQ
jgi:hypothetical protein